MAVFDYQEQVKQAREAAAKADAPASAKRQPQQAPADNAPRAQPLAQHGRRRHRGEIAGDEVGRDERRQSPAWPRPRACSRTRRCSRPSRAPQPQPPLNVIQKTFRAEALARLQRAVLADCGFTERLVVFWSNHFCISANKGELARMWAGSFEREAIRPHVLGRFADMLKAVEQHPAMLFFLDNQQSLGPDSRAGPESQARPERKPRARDHGAAYARRRRRLYAGGRDLARAHHHRMDALPGRQGQLGAPGSFVFNANAHQPGPQHLLGKIYEDNGVAQGEAALADIARHPSTAKFIATKFVRHFVADDPPPALVARLQETFTRTDGDLKALALALVDSDEAWKAPLTKMRSPYEFLVATGRLLARVPEDPGLYLNGLNVLGQPLWSPAGPNGFPDTNAAWAAPEGMKLRLDMSAQVASRIGNNIDPRDLLELGRGGCGLGRDAADDRARGIAAAGAGAAVDVAGISEEMTHGML